MSDRSEWQDTIDLLGGDHELPGYDGRYQCYQIKFTSKTSKCKNERMTYKSEWSFEGPEPV